MSYTDPLGNALRSATLTAINARLADDAYQAAIQARDKAIIEAKDAGATWPAIAEATGMQLPNLYRINATQRAKTQTMKDE